jgi:hypothetical protein
MFSILLADLVASHFSAKTILFLKFFYFWKNYIIFIPYIFIPVLYLIHGITFPLYNGNDNAIILKKMQIMVMVV